MTPAICDVAAMIGKQARNSRRFSSVHRERPPIREAKMAGSQNRTSRFKRFGDSRRVIVKLASHLHFSDPRTIRTETEKKFLALAILWKVGVGPTSSPAEMVSH